MTDFRRVLLGSILFACAQTGAWAELPSPKVVERYRQILAANPVEGAALERLWKMHEEAGQTAALLDSYRSEKTFAARLLLGHFLRRAGQLEGADAAYQQAAKLDPASPLPALALGALHQAEPKVALGWLEKAAAALPADDARRSEVLIQLGSAALDAGDTTRAGAAFDQALALAPQDLDLRRRVAERLAASATPEAAAPHLEFLAKSAPVAERAQALERLARLHQARGDAPAATAALERALAQTAPGNWMRPELQNQLIRLHERSGRIEELEKKWSDAAAANPRDLSGPLQLVALHERLGNLEQQRAWLEKAVQLSPKNTALRHKLARLFLRLGQRDDAAKLLDELLNAQPDNADFVFDRASVDLMRDDASAARERVTAWMHRNAADEGVRGKVLDFYEANRLHEFTEAHLDADAKKNTPESVLALANFYHSQARHGEARATLARLIPAEGTPSVLAAARHRLSEALKTWHLDAEALAEARAAATLQPEQRDYQMALGELERAAGKPEHAAAAYRRAYALSATSAAQIESDQKLHDTLRSLGTDSAVAGTPAESTSREAQTALLEIRREAVENPSEQRWLRAARWHLWTRNVRGAVEAAQRALVLNPKSIAAHQFIVETGTSEAVNSLLELIKTDPANAITHQRRLAQISLQSGRLDEAVSSAREIVAAAPGNLDALTDLAQVQQRAERWADALETWRKVWNIARGDARRDAASAIFRILEKLNRNSEAQAALLAQYDASIEPKDRVALREELLDHARRHSLLPVLRGEFERRHAKRADDYETAMMLSAILGELEEKDRAFDLAAAATLGAANPVETLPALIEQAEERHKLDVAVRLQERLIRVSITPEAGAWEKLAQLQERLLRFEAAEATWKQAVAAYPRDEVLLRKAADFHLKWGGSTAALEILRRLRRLEPASTTHASNLARLALEEGLWPEARDCLDAVLQLTPVERGKTRVVFPELSEADFAFALTRRSVNRLRSRTTFSHPATTNIFTKEKPGLRTSAFSRTEAIRDFARGLVKYGTPEERRQWTSRWRAENDAAERMAAWFYTGEFGLLLDEVEKLSDAETGDISPGKALVWFGLRGRQYDRLRAWLDAPARSQEEVQMLAGVIGAWLRDGATGQQIVEAAEKLIPTSSPGRRMEVARLLASHGWMREALTLGRKAWENAESQRPAFAVELARWQTTLGDAAGARELLAASLAGHGGFIGDEQFTVLRMLVQLAARSEQAALLQKLEKQWDENPDRLHVTMSRLVAYGTAGVDEEAQKAAQQLIALGAPYSPPSLTEGQTAARAYDHILGTGTALLNWRMDHLTAALWSQALADPALVRLREPDAKERDDRESAVLKTRYDALLFAQVAPHEIEGRLAQLTREKSSDELYALADALEQIGAFGRASRLNLMLWELSPENPQALREVINSCRAAGDDDTLIQVLERAVQNVAALPNESARRDYQAQLAELHERQGRREQAISIYGSLIENTPRDWWRFGSRMAALLDLAGRRDEALALCQRAMQAPTPNDNARRMMADLLEKDGKLEEATRLMESAPSRLGDAVLTRLYARQHRTGDALAALERITAGEQISPALQASEATAKFDAREAVLLLRAALARGGDPAALFALQSKLIELLPAGPFAKREAQRLIAMGGDNIEWKTAAAIHLAGHATRLGIEAEMAKIWSAEWRAGAGTIEAGAALVRLELSKDAGNRTELSRLLARKDVSLDALVRLRTALEGDALKSVRLELTKKMVTCRKVRDTELLLALHNEGLANEAREEIARLEPQAALDEESALVLARACATAGEIKSARRWFARAAAADPLSRLPVVHFEFARTLITLGELPLARRAIEAGYRSQTGRDAAVLVEWAAAAGKLGELEQEAARMGIKGVRLNDVRLAVFAAHEKAGRFGDALRVLEAQRELVSADLFSRLAKLAQSSADLAVAAAWLEVRASQAHVVNADLKSALADALTRRAEVNADSPEAFGWLKRAHELMPGAFATAEKYAALLIARGDKATARVVAARHFKAASEGESKEQARKWRRRLFPDEAEPSE